MMGGEEAGDKERAGQECLHHPPDAAALPVHFIIVGSVRRYFRRAMWLLRG